MSEPNDSSPDQLPEFKTYVDSNGNLKTETEIRIADWVKNRVERKIEKDLNANTGNGKENLP